MAPKKKTTAKTAERAFATSAAIMHQQKAFGARWIRAGAAFTDEMDLALALGWPHMRFLVDAHPDDLDPDASAKAGKWAGKGGYGLEWPRDVAARFLRMTAARGYMWTSKPGAPPAVNKAGQQALKKRGAVDVAEAKSLLAELLAVDKHVYSEADFIFILEAMVGPEAVIDGAIDGLEKWTSEDYLRWGDCRIQLVRTLGYPLIRLAKDGAAKRWERLEALFGKWEKGAPGGKLATRRGGTAEQPIQSLDMTLHGAKGVQRSGERVKGHIAPFYATLVHDDAKAVLAVVKKAGKPEKWMVPFPRLAFVGGEPVLDLMTKWWSAYQGGDGPAQVVRSLGVFRSPQVVEMMIHIAGVSDAKDDALAWLAAHWEYAQPLVEQRASKKGDAAKWARAALEAIESMQD